MIVKTDFIEYIRRCGRFTAGIGSYDIALHQRNRSKGKEKQKEKQKKKERKKERNKRKRGSGRGWQNAGYGGLGEEGKGKANCSIPAFKEI